MISCFQFFRKYIGCDCIGTCQCSKSRTIWSSSGRIKSSNRAVHQLVERTIFDQSRNVEMSSALIKTLTELILPHVTVDELDRRRRSAGSRTVFTQFAAENKIDDDVFLKQTVSEREKLRTKISHVHKNLNHASPTVVAEMLERG